MTTTIALALAAVVGALSPLALRYVMIDGLSMTAVSYGVALVIALLASWLTGDLQLTRAGAIAVLSGSTAVWTVQQLVFAALKQSRPALVRRPPTEPTLPRASAR